MAALAFSPDAPTADNREVLVLRNLVVMPAARLVERNDRPVDIGSRAFDLLVLLLRRRGSVVAKDEILHTVWPSTLVTDGNVRLQIAALRRALGDAADLIKTIPGRGYLLAAERTTPAPTPAAEPTVALVVRADIETHHTLEAMLRRLGMQVELFPLQEPRRPASAEGDP
jgi:DNA-binding winged helix-turn-helix (wHTH) protein